MSKLLLVLSVAAIGTLATCHEGSSHSFYDRYCCDDKDCRPLARSDVREGPNGYVVLGQHVVPYGDWRIKDIPVEASDKDAGQFHACIMGGRLRCLYVPQGGY